MVIGCKDNKSYIDVSYIDVTFLKKVQERGVFWSLCGMEKELPKGKGLEGGHTLQAKEMSRLVAPFRARYYCPDGPQATQTSGLCTLGFEQFKAAGLVQAFDLLGHNNRH